MSFDVVSDLQAFWALKPIWNDLLRASGSYTPQLSHEWFAAYWQHLAGDAKVEVLVHKDKNECIVGFTPLMMRRRKDRLGIFNFAELTFLADDRTDYSDFILLDKTRGSILVHQVLPFIARKQKDVDKINLRRIRYSSPNWRMLKRAWGNDFRPANENPIADLGTDYNAFIATRGGNITENLRKARNSAARDGIRLTIRFFTKWDQQLISRLARISENRARIDECHQTVLAKRDPRRFIEAVGPMLSSRGEFAGWTLEANGEVVAYLFGFLVSGTFLAWQTNYDPQFRRYNVGTILIAEAIKDCFARNIRVLNLLISCTPMKLTWSNQMEFLYTYQWQAPNFRNLFQDILRSGKRLVMGQK